MIEQLILDNIPLPTEQEMYLAGAYVKDTRQLTMEVTALQGDAVATRAKMAWKIECLERTVASLLERISAMDTLTADVREIQALLSPGVAA